jgi:hypothetical protein
MACTDIGVNYLYMNLFIFINLCGYSEKPPVVKKNSMYICSSQNVRAPKNNIAQNFILKTRNAPD